MSRYTDLLTTARVALSTTVAPLYWLADLPKQMNEWGDENIEGRARLTANNIELKRQLRALEVKQQQLENIKQENAKLRQLLGAVKSIDYKTFEADVVGIEPNPNAQVVVINQGSRNGVYVGQPVLDQYGIFGQVVSTNVLTSRVLIISDETHAIAAQVMRTGERTVAEGTGQLGLVRLLYIPPTSDLKPGDIISSSGLGEAFPKGYPIGKVETLVRDPNEPFMTVKVRMFAKPTSSRHLILVSVKAKEA